MWCLIIVKKYKHIKLHLFRYAKIYIFALLNLNYTTIKREKTFKKLTFITLAVLAVFVITVNLKGEPGESKSPSADEKGVLNLTSSSFSKTIEEGITIVDFWATWCMPCKIQGPIVADAAKELNGKAKVGKLDIDKNRDIANKYMIRAVPTIIIYKDGKVAKRLLGVQQKEDLVNAVKELQ
ncbi:MAG: thioredoxin [Marinilabiliales bacterium]|nr:MAG: thioredoxin [Marinilabiliales bacterium]